MVYLLVLVELWEYPMKEKGFLGSVRHYEVRMLEQILEGERERWKEQNNKQFFHVTSLLYSTVLYHYHPKKSFSLVSWLW